jgi:hypothetical protein
VHAALWSAVVFGLAAALAAGCGGEDSVATPESTRACLEAVGSDVVSPPLGRFDDIVFGLGLSTPEATAYAGLPSSGVAAVGFFATAGDASATQAALGGLASFADTEPTKTEIVGAALVAWRRPAGAGDRDLLASCLESGGGGAEGRDAEPANPLGCVRVFLTRDATPAQKGRVESTLLGHRFIREVRFVSKEEALKAFRKEQPELTKNLHTNPLPDAFVAGPKRGEKALPIAASVRGVPGVEHVSVSSLPCSLSASSTG